MRFLAAVICCECKQHRHHCLAHLHALVAQLHRIDNLGFGYRHNAVDEVTDDGPSVAPKSSCGVDTKQQ